MKRSDWPVFVTQGLIGTCGTCGTEVICYRAGDVLPDDHIAKIELPGYKISFVEFDCVNPDGAYPVCLKCARLPQRLIYVPIHKSPTEYGFEDVKEIPTLTEEQEAEVYRCLERIKALSMAELKFAIDESIKAGNKSLEDIFRAELTNRRRQQRWTQS